MRNGKGGKRKGVPRHSRADTVEQGSIQLGALLIVAGNRLDLDCIKSDFLIPQNQKLFVHHVPITLEDASKKSTTSKAFLWIVALCTSGFTHCMTR